MTENREINENVTMPTIILTEPGECGTPEPRKLFRKRVNGVGLTLLGNIAVTLAISYLAMYAPVLYYMISGNYSGTAQTLGDLYGDNYYIILLIASSLAALIGNTLPGIIHAKRQSFSAFEGFKKGVAVPQLGFKCIVVAFGFNYLWAILYSTLITLFPNSGIDSSEFGLAFPEKTGELIVYFIYVCVIAPLTEEFLFRGVVLHSLSKYGALFAGFTSALLFGLLHGNIQQAPMAFLVGLVLAYAAVRTGSLRLPIFIHFSINTTSSLVSLAIMRGSETLNYSVTSLYAVLMFAALIATFVILISDRRKIQWLPQNPASSHTVFAPVKTKVRAKLLYMLICLWMLAFIVYCVDTINYSLGNKAILEILGELLYPVLSPIING